MAGSGLTVSGAKQLAERQRRQRTTIAVQAEQSGGPGFWARDADAAGLESQCFVKEGLDMTC